MGTAAACQPAELKFTPCVPKGMTIRTIPSTSTCLRQVEGEMNNSEVVVISTITPKGSATLPFVIPSKPRDLQFREPFLEIFHKA
jgi:hypothetical protein